MVERKRLARRAIYQKTVARRRPRYSHVDIRSPQFIEAFLTLGTFVGDVLQITNKSDTVHSVVSAARKSFVADKPLQAQLNFKLHEIGTKLSAVDASTSEEEMHRLDAQMDILTDVLQRDVGVDERD